jgi:hypothetical protein
MELRRQNSSWQDAPLHLYLAVALIILAILGGIRLI